MEYGINEEPFEEYEELGVKPELVFQKKGEHQEALMMLAKRIADELAKEGSYSSDGEDKEKRKPIAA